MSPAPGRNDPCPCGSGRKYKRCCQQSLTITPQAYTRAERTGAFTKLLRFAHRAEFADDRALAEQEFWSDRRERMAPHQADEIGADQQLLGAFLTWLGFDFALIEGPDLTLAHRFLRTRAGDLSTGERIWIERMADSTLRLFEITAVRLDQGLSLTDLVSGERLDVTERSATHQLSRWDVLAVRVIEGPAGTLELEGYPYQFPRPAAHSVRDQIVRGRKAASRRGGPWSDVGFAKSLGAELHHLWLDLVVNAPTPRVVTAEGDELVFTSVVFEVTDEARVDTALARHPDLESHEDGISWVEPTAGMPRILGSLTRKPGRLVLDTQSSERAARGRALLEAALGDAVRYRLTTSQDIEPALAEAEDRGPTRRREPEIPAEVEQQIVGEFLERHYRGWVDEPIPALGGRTPRHAARLKTIRPRVIELLKDLENGMARERAAGRPAIDLDWLWAELGLSNRAI